MDNIQSDGSIDAMFLPTVIRLEVLRRERQLKRSLTSDEFAVAEFEATRGHYLSNDCCAECKS